MADREIAVREEKLYGMRLRELAALAGRETIPHHEFAKESLVFAILVKEFGQERVMRDYEESMNPHRRKDA